MNTIVPSSVTPARSAPRRRLRGQALVETAIMLPVILILLLGAVDFGRVFFSWVTLHQAARIGANHASIHPTTTSADIPAVIQTETDVINCAMDPPSLTYTSGGAPVASPEIGHYAELRLSCRFSLLTPLAGFFFGDPIPMTAYSSFPVRTGCVSCGSGPGATPPPPPPPPPEQCRTIPNMGGLSVAGAELAWQSAGFTGAFNAGGAPPSATVDPDSVDEGSILITPADASCPWPLAFFGASVTVDTLAPEPEVGCAVVPNLLGMEYVDAEAVWNGSGFAGQSLVPSDPAPAPDAVVESQTTSPTTSEPGVSCLVAGTDVTQMDVVVGDPWADPPSPPCQVPHMIDKQRSAGYTDWVTAGFAGANFSPATGNFKIKWQSLVGFSWAECSASIAVDSKAP